MSDIRNNMFEDIFFKDFENQEEIDLFQDLLNPLTSNFTIPSNSQILLFPSEINNPTGPTSTTTKKVHDNNSLDNLLRKIQNHYINFIIDFLNEYLKQKNIEKKLLKIDYNFKKNVKKIFVQELKTKKLRDIIINNISVKYKNHESDANKKCLEEIETNEIYKNVITELNKLLSINYLDLFRKIYYKGDSYVDLKEFGIATIIKLGNKVEMFNDLLRKNMSLGEEHVKNILKCALKNYFPGYLFYLEK